MLLRERPRSFSDFTHLKDQWTTLKKKDVWQSIILIKTTTQIEQWGIN